MIHKKRFMQMCLFLLMSTVLFAQNTISGLVVDAKTGEPVFLANVVIKGKLIGGATDFDGFFSIFGVEDKGPHTLEVHCVGYRMKVIENVMVGEVDEIQLEEEVYGEAVVVTASRKSESILESGTTVAKMDAIAIKDVPAPSFYDGLAHLPSVDIVTASIGMKTINMRGFNSTSPDRMVQFIDGMDNQAPALNFPVSNLVGMSELDIAGVEVIYGAASTLYGPNAFNGVVSMSSKSPWEFPGISARVSGGEQGYFQAMARIAQVYDNTFAFKLNASTMKADEWTTGNYYGNSDLKAAGLGFDESDLTDDKAENLKLSGSLHYRLSDKAEISYSMNYGQGSTVYQGAQRYNVKNFSMQQHKIELNGKTGNDSYKIKAYRTIDDSGDTYNIGLTAAHLFAQGVLAKDDAKNYGYYYATAYKGALAGGMTEAQADAFAKGEAAKAPKFQAVYDDIVKKPLGVGAQGRGARIMDESSITNFDAQYNTELSGINTIAGFSYRQFDPESNGTLFRDKGTVYTSEDLGDIKVSEYGFYTQLEKRVLDDRLKITASARYDKHENFDGQFSPGIQLVYSLKSDSDRKNNGNFRFSYQTAFRNPSLQDQYIGLNVGSANVLDEQLASLPNSVTAVLWGNHNGYKNSRAVDATVTAGLSKYLATQSTAIAALVPKYMGLGMSQEQATQAATAEIGEAYLQQHTAEIEAVKPEQVKSFEFGYKSIIWDKVFVDLNYYQQEYTDFIQDKRFFVMRGTGPLFADAATANMDLYMVDSNSDKKVKVRGYSASLNYNINENYSASMNWANAKVTEGKNTGFNTPENKYNFGFSGRRLGNFGFNLAYKYVEEFEWNGSGFKGQVPSYDSFNAALLYDFKMSGQNLTAKLAASNLFVKKHREAFGTPMIGRMIILQLSTEF